MGCSAGDRILERDLKIKVVWALAAEMCLTYHILKIENPVPGGGTLLTGNYAPGQGPLQKRNGPPFRSTPSKPLTTGAW